MSIRSKKLRIIIPFVCFLLLGFQKQIEGSEWISYASTKIGNYCYDNEGVKSLSNSKLAVWTKLVVFTEEKRLAYINNHKSGINDRTLDDWSNEVSKLEINCSAKTVRLIRATSYDRSGGVIYSNNFSDLSRGEEIIPESQMEYLYKTLCEKKDFLKKQRNWKFYFSSDAGTYYYDASNIESISKNTVRIWTKEIISNKFKTKSLEDSFVRKEMRDFLGRRVYDINLYQFNCSDRNKELLLKSTSHDIEGNGFSSVDFSEAFESEGGMVSPLPDQQLGKIACGTRSAEQGKKGLKKKKSKD